MWTQYKFDHKWSKTVGAFAHAQSGYKLARVAYPGAVSERVSADITVRDEFCDKTRYLTIEPRNAVQVSASDRR